MYGPLLIAALLLPLVVLVAVGVGIPLGRAVTNSLFGGDRFAEPYRVLASDHVFWRVLIRTIAVAGIVSATCLLIAYPTAEFIYRASPKIRPVLLALVVVPLWTSTIARVYGWVGVFVRDGVIDRVASVFGAGPLHLLYTRTSVTVGMIHASLPLMLLVAYAAVRRYDDRLTMASLSLGAGRLRTLVRVKLPVLGPLLISGTVGVFILALGFFEVPALLGGPDSQMISNLIYQQAAQRFDIGRAQAMSVIFLVVTLAVLGLAGLCGWTFRRSQR